MTGLTLAALNAAGRTEFRDWLGGICEDSPWVAERAADLHPFASVAALADAFAEVLAAASEPEQLAVLRAHPDLAGRLARAGQVAEQSQSEQQGAGLDRLPDDALDAARADGGSDCPDLGQGWMSFRPFDAGEPTADTRARLARWCAVAHGE